MPVGIVPSEFCGTTYDQLSGAGCVMAWGLDATKQLAAGQVVSAPTCTVTDLTAGGADVSASLLSGSPSVGPNAAGTADMVVTQAITNAVAGHIYELRVNYTPSPPSPGNQQQGLVLHLVVTI